MFCFFLCCGTAQWKPNRISTYASSYHCRQNMAKWLLFFLYMTDLNQQLIHILHHNFSEEHIAFWLQIPAPSSAVRWGLNLGPHNRFNSLNDRKRFNSLKYRKRGNFNLKLIDIWDGKQWLYCIILVLMASNPGKKPCQKDEIFSLTTRVGT